MNDILNLFTGGTAVADLRERMLQEPQAEVPSHFIQGGGVAIKTVLIKAGTVAIGGVHKVENMSYMSKGDILVATADGVKRYTVVDSPVIVVAPAGVERVVYALADTYWSSIHPTDKTDIEEVRKDFIEEPTTKDLPWLG